MKSQYISAALSLSAIITRGVAWPLLRNPLERRQPAASYSVVAVDGGQATTAVTHTETILKTQLSTIVVTRANAPQTIVVTVTTATTVEEIVTADGVAPAPTTVTVTDSPETRPFDNGQWHTTYFYTVDNASPTPSPEPSSSSPTASSSSAWVNWGGSDGQYNGPPPAGVAPDFDDGMWKAPNVTPAP